jgi:hypothetical protein
MVNYITVYGTGSLSSRNPLAKTLVASINGSLHLILDALCISEEEQYIGYFEYALCNMIYHAYLRKIVVSKYTRW